MAGVHDMGARSCDALIDPEVDEPIFHAEWEKTALATTLAMGFCGFWNIDVSRHARERIGWDNYLQFSYYKIWISGLEKLLIENGVAILDEIKTGKVANRFKRPFHRIQADQVGDILKKGGPVDRKVTREPKYKIGDIIKTKVIETEKHTRLPAYCMGKSGEISSIQGFHVFPDSNSQGQGENPQWVYNVKFSARELFGEGARRNHDVNLDLWEPYFE